MPHLWHDLNLSSASAKKTVSKKFISTCIRCSRGKFRAATLKFFSEQFPLNDFYYLARRFGKLKYLHCVDNSIKYEASSLSAELRMPSNLTTIIIGREAAITVESLTHILDNHELLITAKFHDIHGRSWTRFKGLGKVYSQLRNGLLGHALADGDLTLNVVGVAVVLSKAFFNNIVTGSLHTQSSQPSKFPLTQHRVY